MHCEHDLDNGVVVQTDFLVWLYLTPHSCLVCLPSLDQYAKVCRVVGKVMYEVKLEYLQKVVRRYVNQIRNRSTLDFDMQVTTSPPDEIFLHTLVDLAEMK